MTEPRLLRAITAARAALAFNDGLNPGYTADEKQLLSKNALQRINDGQRALIFNELDTALDALDSDYD
jgi:hypothetical protein